MTIVGSVQLNVTLDTSNVDKSINEIKRKFEGASFTPDFKLDIDDKNLKDIFKGKEPILVPVRFCESDIQDGLTSLKNKIRKSFDSFCIPVKFCDDCIQEGVTNLKNKINKTELNPVIKPIIEVDKNDIEKSLKNVQPIIKTQLEVDEKSLDTSIVKTTKNKKISMMSNIDIDEDTFLKKINIVINKANKSSTIKPNIDVSEKQISRFINKLIKANSKKSTIKPSVDVDEKSILNIFKKINNNIILKPRVVIDVKNLFKDSNNDKSSTIKKTIINDTKNVVSEKILKDSSVSANNTKIDDNKQKKEIENGFEIGVSAKISKESLKKIKLQLSNEVFNLNVNPGNIGLPQNIGGGDSGSSGNNTGMASLAQSIASLTAVLGLILTTIQATNVVVTAIHKQQLKEASGGGFFSKIFSGITGIFGRVTDKFLDNLGNDLYTTISSGLIETVGGTLLGVIGGKIQDAVVGAIKSGLGSALSGFIDSKMSEFTGENVVKGVATLFLGQVEKAIFGKDENMIASMVGLINTAANGNNQDAINNAIGTANNLLGNLNGVIGAVTGIEIPKEISFKIPGLDNVEVQTPVPGAKKSVGRPKKKSQQQKEESGIGVGVDISIQSPGSDKTSTGKPKPIKKINKPIFTPPNLPEDEIKNIAEKLKEQYTSKGLLEISKALGIETKASERDKDSVSKKLAQSVSLPDIENIAKDLGERIKVKKPEPQKQKTVLEGGDNLIKYLKNVNDNLAEKIKKYADGHDNFLSIIQDDIEKTIKAIDEIIETYEYSPKLGKSLGGYKKQLIAKRKQVGSLIQNTSVPENAPSEIPELSTNINKEKTKTRKNISKPRPTLKPLALSTPVQQIQSQIKYPTSVPLPTPIPNIIPELTNQTESTPVQTPIQKIQDIKVPKPIVDVPIVETPKIDYNNKIIESINKESIRLKNVIDDYKNEGEGNLIVIKNNVTEFIETIDELLISYKNIPDIKTQLSNIKKDIKTAKQKLPKTRTVKPKVETPVVEITPSPTPIPTPKPTRKPRATKAPKPVVETPVVDVTPIPTPKQKKVKKTPESTTVKTTTYKIPEAEKSENSFLEFSEAMLGKSLRSRQSKPATTVQPQKVVTPKPEIENSTALVKSTNDIVEKMAISILNLGGLIKPILLTQTGINTYEVLAGELEFEAAKRAKELNLRVGEMINAIIVPQGLEAEYKAAYTGNYLDKPDQDVTKVYNRNDAESHTRPKLVDVSSISQAKNANIPLKPEVNKKIEKNNENITKMAKSILDLGNLVKPILLKKTGENEYKLLAGKVEFLAAQKAQELNPREGEMINAIIVPDGRKEEYIKAYNSDFTGEIELINKNVSSYGENIKQWLVDVSSITADNLAEIESVKIPELTLPPVLTPEPSPSPTPIPETKPKATKKPKQKNERVLDVVLPELETPLNNLKTPVTTPVQAVLPEVKKPKIEGASAEPTKMNDFTDVGVLKHLPIVDVKPNSNQKPIDTALVKKAAESILQSGGRNFVPVIVKKIAEYQYEVVGNNLMLAASQMAGLVKVWAIVADSVEQDISQIELLTKDIQPLVVKPEGLRDDGSKMALHADTTDFGVLKNFAISDVSPRKEGLDANFEESIVKNAAEAILKSGGRNWVPIMVKEIAEYQYEVVGGDLIYAAAQMAELTKVWSIVVETFQGTFSKIESLTDKINVDDIEIIDVIPETKPKATKKPRAKKEPKPIVETPVIDVTTIPTPKQKKANKPKSTPEPTPIPTVQPQKVVAPKLEIENSTALVKNTNDIVEKMAISILNIGGLIKPILLTQTGINTYEVLAGELEFEAAKRAKEINQSVGEMINAIIVPKGLEEKYIADYTGNYQDDPNQDINKVTKREDVVRQQIVDVSSITSTKGIDKKNENKNVSEKSIESIAKSIIELKGLVKPILLKKTGVNSYEVLAGKKEFEAAKRAKELNLRQSEQINAVIAPPGREEEYIAAYNNDLKNISADISRYGNTLTGYFSDDISKLGNNITQWLVDVSTITSTSVDSISENIDKLKNVTTLPSVLTPEPSPTPTPIPETKTEATRKLRAKKEPKPIVETPVVEVIPKTKATKKTKAIKPVVETPQPTLAPVIDVTPIPTPKPIVAPVVEPVTQPMGDINKPKIEQSYIKDLQESALELDGRVNRYVALGKGVAEDIIKDIKSFNESIDNISNTYELTEDVSSAIGELKSNLEFKNKALLDIVNGTHQKSTKKEIKYNEFDLPEPEADDFEPPIEPAKKKRASNARPPKAKESTVETPKETIQPVINGLNAKAIKDYKTIFKELGKKLGVDIEKITLPNINVKTDFAVDGVKASYEEMLNTVNVAPELLDILNAGISESIDKLGEDTVNESLSILVHELTHAFQAGVSKISMDDIFKGQPILSVQSFDIPNPGEDLAKQINEISKKSTDAFIESLKKLNPLKSYTQINKEYAVLIKEVKRREIEAYKAEAVYSQEIIKSVKSRANKKGTKPEENLPKYAARNNLGDEGHQLYSMGDSVPKSKKEIYEKNRERLEKERALSTKESKSKSFGEFKSYLDSENINPAIYVTKVKNIGNEFNKSIYDVLSVSLDVIANIVNSIGDVSNLIQASINNLTGSIVNLSSLLSSNIQSVFEGISGLSSSFVSNIGSLAGSISIPNVGDVLGGVSGIIDGFGETLNNSLFSIIDMVSGVSSNTINLATETVNNSNQSQSIDSKDLQVPPLYSVGIPKNNGLTDIIGNIFSGITSSFDNIFKFFLGGMEDCMKNIIGLNGKFNKDVENVKSKYSAGINFDAPEPEEEDDDDEFTKQMKANDLAWKKERAAEKKRGYVVSNVPEKVFSEESAAESIALHKKASRNDTASLATDKVLENYNKIFIELAKQLKVDISNVEIPKLNYDKNEENIPRKAYYRSDDNSLGITNYSRSMFDVLDNDIGDAVKEYGKKEVNEQVSILVHELTHALQLAIEKNPEINLGNVGSKDIALPQVDSRNIQQEIEKGTSASTNLYKTGLKYRSPDLPSKEYNKLVADVKRKEKEAYTAQYYITGHIIKAFQEQVESISVAPEAIKEEVSQLKPESPSLSLYSVQSALSSGHGELSTSKQQKFKEHQERLKREFAISRPAVSRNFDEFKANINSENINPAIHVKKIKNVGNEFNKSIYEILNISLDVIVGIVNSIDNVGNLIQASINNLTGAITNLSTFLSSNINSIFEGISDLSSGVVSNIGGLVGSISVPDIGSMFNIFNGDSNKTENILANQISQPQSLPLYSVGRPIVNSGNIQSPDSNNIELPDFGSFISDINNQIISSFSDIEILELELSDINIEEIFNNSFNGLVDIVGNIYNSVESTISNIELPDFTSLDVSNIDAPDISVVGDVLGNVYGEIESLVSNVDLPNIENVEIPEINLDDISETIGNIYNQTEGFVSNLELPNFNNLELPEFEIPEIPAINLDDIGNSIENLYNNIESTISNLEIPTLELPKTPFVSEIAENIGSSVGNIYSELESLASNVDLPSIEIPAINLDDIGNSIGNLYNNVESTVSNLEFPEFDLPEIPFLNEISENVGDVVGNVYGEIESLASNVDLPSIEIPAINLDDIGNSIGNLYNNVESTVSNLEFPEFDLPEIPFLNEISENVGDVVGNVYGEIESVFSEIDLPEIPYVGEAISGVGDVVGNLYNQAESAIVGIDIPTIENIELPDLGEVVSSTGDIAGNLYNNIASTISSIEVPDIDIGNVASNVVGAVGSASEAVGGIFSFMSGQVSGVVSNFTENAEESAQTVNGIDTSNLSEISNDFGSSFFGAIGDFYNTIESAVSGFELPDVDLPDFSEAIAGFYTNLENTIRNLDVPDPSRITLPSHSQVADFTKSAYQILKSNIGNLVVNGVPAINSLGETAVKELLLVLAGELASSFTEGVPEGGELEAVVTAAFEGLGVDSTLIDSIKAEVNNLVEQFRRAYEMDVNNTSSGNNQNPNAPQSDTNSPQSQPRQRLSTAPTPQAWLGSALRGQLGGLNDLMEFVGMFDSIEDFFNKMKNFGGVLTTAFEISRETNANVEDLKARFFNFIEGVKTSRPAMAPFIDIAMQGLEMFRSYTILSTVGGLFMDLAKSSVEVAGRFEVLNNITKFLAGSNVETAKTFTFLKGEVSRLGLDTEAAIKGWNKLAATTRGTTLEGDVTKGIFSGVAQAGTAFGLTSEEMEGSIVAMSQIAGKGVVSMEELRGQLAERIPGAFQLAARAMNMTEQELTGLISTGKLAATDFLPNFAKQLSLETAGSIETASKTFAAASIRYKNSITNFQAKFGEKMLPVISGYMNMLSGYIDKVSISASGLAYIFITVMDYAFYSILDNLAMMGKILISTPSIILSVGAAFATLKTIIMSVLMPAISGIAKSMVGAFIFQKGIQMVMFVWDTFAGKVAATDINKSLTKSFKEAGKKTDELREKLAKLRGEIDKNGKPVKQKTKDSTNVSELAVDQEAELKKAGIFDDLTGQKAALRQNAMIVAWSKDIKEKRNSKILKESASGGEIKTLSTDVQNILSSSDSIIAKAKEKNDAIGKLTVQAKSAEGKNLEDIKKQIEILQKESQVELFKAGDIKVGDTKDILTKGLGISGLNKSLGLANIDSTAQNVSSTINKLKTDLEDTVSDEPRKVISDQITKLEEYKKKLDDLSKQIGSSDSITQFLIDISKIGDKFEQVSYDTDKSLIKIKTSINKNLKENLTTDFKAENNASLEQVRSEIFATQAKLKASKDLVDSLTGTIKASGGAIGEYIKEFETLSLQKLQSELEKTDEKDTARKSALEALIKLREGENTTLDLQSTLQEQLLQQERERFRVAQENLDREIAISRAKVDISDANAQSVSARRQIMGGSSQADIGLIDADNQLKSAQQKEVLRQQELAGIRKLHEDKLISAKDYETKVRELTVQGAQNSLAILQAKLGEEQALRAKEVENIQRTLEQSKVQSEAEQADKGFYVERKGFEVQQTNLKEQVSTGKSDELNKQLEYQKQLFEKSGDISKQEKINAEIYQNQLTSLTAKQDLQTKSLELTQAQQRLEMQRSDMQAKIALLEAESQVNQLIANKATAEEISVAQQTVDIRKQQVNFVSEQRKNLGEVQKLEKDNLTVQNETQKKDAKRSRNLQLIEEAEKRITKEVEITKNQNDIINKQLERKIQLTNSNSEVYKAQSEALKSQVDYNIEIANKSNNIKALEVLKFASYSLQLQALNEQNKAQSYSLELSHKQQRIQAENDILDAQANLRKLELNKASKQDIDIAKRQLKSSKEQLTNVEAIQQNETERVGVEQQSALANLERQRYLEIQELEIQKTTKEIENQTKLYDAQQTILQSTGELDKQRLDFQLELANRSNDFNKIEQLKAEIYLQQREEILRQNESQKVSLELSQKQNNIELDRQLLQAKSGLLQAQLNLEKGKLEGLSENELHNLEQFVIIQGHHLAGITEQKILTDNLNGLQKENLDIQQQAKLEQIDQQRQLELQDLAIQKITKSFEKEKAELEFITSQLDLQNAELDRQSALQSAKSGLNDSVSNLEKQRLDFRMQLAELSENEVQKQQIKQQLYEQELKSLAQRQEIERETLKIAQQKQDIDIKRQETLAEIATLEAQAEIEKAKARDAGSAEMAALEKVLGLRQQQEQSVQADKENVAKIQELEKQKLNIDQTAANENLQQQRILDQARAAKEQQQKNSEKGGKGGVTYNAGVSVNAGVTYNSVPAQPIYLSEADRNRKPVSGMTTSDYGKTSTDAKAKKAKDEIIESMKVTATNVYINGKISDNPNIPVNPDEQKKQDIVDKITNLQESTLTDEERKQAIVDKISRLQESVDNENPQARLAKANAEMDAYIAKFNADAERERIASGLTAKQATAGGYEQAKIAREEAAKITADLASGKLKTTGADGFTPQQIKTPLQKLQEELQSAQKAVDSSKKQPKPVSKSEESGGGTNVNVENLVIVSNDPTGDARQVLNDLAANKGKC